MTVQVVVQHPQVANDPAAHIGQQRIRDPLLCREPGQRLYRVVTDRKQRDLGAVEIRGDLLQLDELRFTVRSPPRAAVEDHKRPAAPSRLLKAHRDSGLIRQRDVGKPRSDRRTLSGQLVRHSTLRRACVARYNERPDGFLPRRRPGATGDGASGSLYRIFTRILHDSTERRAAGARPVAATRTRGETM
jgi:hypothetical protein